MPKTKTNWILIYAPPFEDDEYAGQRLFIKDGDPTRIFVADNSGENPDRCDDKRCELDLSKPGSFSATYGYEENYEIPGWLEFATTDGCRVGAITFEAGILLAEKWGATLENNLSPGMATKLKRLVKVTRCMKGGK